MAIQNDISSIDDALITSSQYQDCDSNHKMVILSTDDTNSANTNPANLDSTNTNDLLVIQMQEYNTLLEYTQSFVNRLYHTTFEDGMSNPAIEYVEHTYRKSPFVTCTWLYSVYAQNQHDEVVIDGLLRIIAYIEMPQIIAQAFIPMLKLALIDTSINCQETAIMLCEVWRSKECLECLMQAEYKDCVLQKYADDVIQELNTELNYNAA